MVIVDNHQSLEDRRILSSEVEGCCWSDVTAAETESPLLIEFVDICCSNTTESELPRPTLPSFELLAEKVELTRARAP